MPHKFHGFTQKITSENQRYLRELISNIETNPADHSSTHI